MLDGPSVAKAIADSGVTDVVWIPDSELGLWEEGLRAEARLRLIRACREGEAIVLAAGLLLGGRRPMVMIQCTGLFEAGDALRNIVHDLKLPLFLVVGVRSYFPHQQGTSLDSCPVFTEPILQAWRIPYVLLHKDQGADALAAAYQQARQERRAGAVLLPEGGP